MTNSLEFKLAKLLIAAAWADGEVTSDEVNILKDLIFNLPDINGKDWQLLELYMDSPIKGEETNLLLNDVMSAVSSNADKLMVSNTLKALINADGDLSADEEKFIEKVQAALNDKNTNPVSLLAGFFKKTVSFKGQEIPKREQHFHDYIKNTVYYQLHHDGIHGDFSVDDTFLRKLSLKAGLMAKVCYLDGEADDTEINTVTKALQELGNISEEEALMLGKAGFNRAAKGLDFSHICRSYFEVTEYEERCDFLKLLFKVAAASNGSCHEEIQRIRDISIHLKIPHSKYIDAKMTVFPD
jgi:uncharacterized tellurite resistance protein B-like protein